MHHQFLGTKALTEPRTARHAAAAWFGLIDDLDALQPTYLDEYEGAGPVHDTLDQLTGLILSYAPADADEARAILAITDHDRKAGLEWTGYQRDARDRAARFLREAHSDGEA